MAFGLPGRPRICGSTVTSSRNIPTGFRHLGSAAQSGRQLRRDRRRAGTRHHHRVRVARAGGSHYAAAACGLGPGVGRRRRHQPEAFSRAGVIGDEVTGFPSSLINLKLQITNNTQIPNSKRLVLSA